jgi:hypothetical protein
MKTWITLFVVAVTFSAARNVKAVDVDFSIGSRHHGGYVELHTGDPVYSSWYPSSTTYVYSNPGYSNSYYVNRAPSYSYRTHSDRYNNWYGDRNRYRRYQRHHDRDHNHDRDRDHDRDHDHHDRDRH